MRVALGFSCSNRAHCETSFLNCAGISVRPKSFQSHKTIAPGVLSLPFG